ncbi:snRNA-activating protein complex subunit 2 isoform X2 [Scleropages formosus]|uniref:snRNA-activating protein complex subunit 2-like n=1 Tax=Scleropages formosus TaxID=113540 RepID=A0A8C9VQD1_SCLFO|nr:snRNA-activating protein complex subunit 2 isoform X2 [Scleropages formosus]
MKPPSRPRAVPQRFQTKQTESQRPPRMRSVWCTWRAVERRHLLAGLRRQSSKAEVDLDALQKKLPKRSVQEISSFLEFLKGRVGRCVVHRVWSQKREERKEKVPIQLWSDLAKTMVGSLEEAISSAFSQVLVIGATEPCSLLHSDPPHHISISELTESSLHTILPKPKITSTSNDKLRTMGPSNGAEPPPKDPLQGTAVVAVTPSTHQLSPTLVSSGPSEESESIISPSPAHANQPAADQNHLKKKPSSSPQPDPPVQEGTNTGFEGPSQRDTSSSQLPASAQQPSQNKPKEKDYIVNFENIYHFLNALNKKAKEPILTPMESAVVLDLLLSLPEELRLLDCQALQSHLRQVYMRLTATAEATHGKQRPCSLSPALCHTPSGIKVPKQELTSHLDSGQTDISEDADNRSIHHLGNGDDCSLEKQINTGDRDKDGSVDLSEANQRDESMELNSSESPNAPAAIVNQSGECVFSSNKTVAMQNLADAESSLASPSLGPGAGQKADWSTVGLCPLNPFMIPLKLLARSAMIPVVADDSQLACPTVDAASD